MKQIEIKKARIAVHSIPGIRSIYFYLLIRGGYWHEKENRWGNLHLLEHLTNRATQKLLNPTQITDFKERNGISSNAWTSSNHVGYWFKFPDFKTKQALMFIENIIFKPLITSEILEKEKEVVKNEYNSYRENPYNRFYKVWLKQMFGEKHVFARATALGKLKNLKKTNTKLIINLHKKYYQPQNMSIGVAGNFNETKMINLIKNLLKDKNNGKIQKINFSKTFKTEKLVKYQDSVKQSLVSFSWFFPGENKTTFKEKLTLNIAKRIIDKKTYHKLRYKKGLVYSSGVKRRGFPNISIFEIWAKTQPKNIRQIISEIKKIVDNFWENGISKKEFLQLRQNMDIKTIMSYDSAGRIAERFAYDLFYEKKVFLAEDLLKITQDIKFKDIKKIMYKYFQWNKHQITIMSPK